MNNVHIKAFVLTSGRYLYCHRFDVLLNICFRLWAHQAGLENKIRKWPGKSWQVIIRLSELPCPLTALQSLDLRVQLGSRGRWKDLPNVKMLCYKGNKSLSFLLSSPSNYEIDLNSHRTHSASLFHHHTEAPILPTCRSSPARALPTPRPARWPARWRPSTSGRSMA